MTETISIELRIMAGDLEDTERLSLGLKRDLEQMPGASARFATTSVPVGRKSGAGIDWTQLMLTLAASGGVLTGLVGLIQARLSRDRKVRIVVDGDELEMSSVDSTQQQQLIEAWLARQCSKTSRPASTQ